MKTRRAGFALLAILLVVGQLVPVHAQQARGAQTNHCLWKVQGSNSTAYLLGSIHFLTKDFYPLGKPIEDAYTKSQVVVFEADFDDMKTPQNQMKVMEAAKYPEGQTLKQNVSKETYDKLQTYVADSLGGDASAFDPMKPWMVAVALLGVELQRLGFDPEHGVDRYFFQKAKGDKKEIVGLETVAFQLGLFSDLTKEEQEAMLKETLQEISNFKRDLNELTKAWREGDAKKLDELILDAMREYPKLRQKLLIDRNKAWADKTEKLLAGGKTVFVVVGAAHLVGKDNVGDFLAKKGFKIQQM